MRCVLGIDTSCYTTSVALAFEDGRVFQKRKLLNVPDGARGLQQSAGVFQHVQNLPALMEALTMEHEGYRVTAVCASEKPRGIPGSYMPVFTVGAGAARQIAAALGVPYIPADHQRGHVRAALLGTDLIGKPFLGFHLSGGTTEVLSVDEKLKISLIGGASDITAGQLIDRVGVKLGLSFPAGPALERLAMEGESASAMPTSIKGVEASFSGAEAQAMRMIARGTRSEDVAAEVFSVVARTLAKIVERIASETEVMDVLMAGGVASSRLLQKLLYARLQKTGSHAKIYWADPEYAGDNAVGVALIGLTSTREAHV